MQLAIKNSKYSNDPTTKVGCVIVRNDKVIANGYNHFVELSNKQIKIPQKIHPTDETKDKRIYSIHAEMDAIMKLKNRKNLCNATLFVTLHPCHECAKHILFLGIKNIFYLDLDKRHAHESTFIIAQHIFSICKTNIKQVTK
jgi:dCMP deaminase